MSSAVDLEFFTELYNGGQRGPRFESLGKDRESNQSQLVGF